MILSDTTNKNGMVQRFEFWTRMKDGTVTGTLLKTVVAGFNSGLDRLMPRLMSYSDYIRWDDAKHTDQPIGYMDIVSGQADYKYGEDANELDILNIGRVRAKQASTGDYVDLERVYVNSDMAFKMMSPNSAETGIPTYYLEVGNRLYLHPAPNYDSTNGIEFTFEREQEYFVSTTLDKEAGIPKPFQELPVLYHARDWVAVNRSNDAGLFNVIDREIARQEQNLDDLISMRNPTQNRALPASHSNK